MTEQWGDPIDVNGVRPAWLRDEVKVLPFWDGGMGWYCWEGGASAKCVAGWPRVTKIRLPADHWAYPVIAKGFTPWDGGDHAPDDWDGGKVLRAGDGTPWVAPWGQAPWHWAQGDIIGYKRKEAQMDDAPEWAIARVDELTEECLVSDAFARYIASKEEPPLDPDLIAAREVVCGYHHDKHPESPWHVGQAEMVRSGRFDNMLDVQAAYHGIKRGRAMERGE